MYSEKMENYHKKHGKCSENHGKAPKNDGPELPPVGAQAWKIPNLVANGAQHLLQKEICREKKNRVKHLGICWRLRKHLMVCFGLRILGHKEDKLWVDDSGSISFQSPPKTFFSLASLLFAVCYSAVEIKHITHFPRYISQKSPFCDNGLFEEQNRKTVLYETGNIGGERNRFA